MRGVKSDVSVTLTLTLEQHEMEWLREISRNCLIDPDMESEDECKIRREIFDVCNNALEGGIPKQRRRRPE